MLQSICIGRNFFKQIAQYFEKKSKQKLFDYLQKRVRGMRKLQRAQREPDQW